jgi:hypothetical protein
MGDCIETASNAGWSIRGKTLSLSSTPILSLYSLQPAVVSHLSILALSMSKKDIQKKTSLHLPSIPYRLSNPPLQIPSTIPPSPLMVSTVSYFPHSVIVSAQNPRKLAPDPRLTLNEII